MTKFLATLAILTACPAMADTHSATGDPAAGEAAYGNCGICHVVQNPAGAILAGEVYEGAPNLYGIAGAQMGSVDGFFYSRSMRAAAETGAVWTEDAFVEFSTNPDEFLRTLTGNEGARTNMYLEFTDAEAARNIYAYLLSLAE